MEFFSIRKAGRRFLVITFCLALLAPALPGQVHHRKTAPRRAVHRSTRPASPRQVRYTGVWEPMNYPDDINITEVYFVTPDVGWIAAKGKGGALLHTSDGGRNWDAQLGDVQGSDEEFSHLQFIDQLHGWAVQKGGKLLRTTDGKNWEQAGTLPKFHPLSSVKFTSVRNGVFVGGYANEVSIFKTRDGGRNWKEVFKCTTRLTVDGLARNVGCHLMSAYFPSAKVGYAVGGGYNGGYMVVAKTEDGGANWRLVFSTTELETAESVFFTSETDGFVVTRDKKLYSTSDGGRTWRGLVATVDAKAPVLFTDPEVAWTCWRQTCSFSTDSGRHWHSREFRFPAYINAFSVPRRDRIYVAGDHGMIYRYRMLPVSRVTKAMLPAPSMPGYGSLNRDLQRIRTKIDALRTKLAEAGAPVQDDAAGSAAGTDAASGSFENSADADAAFNQDTTFSGSDTASGGSFDAGTPAPDVPASDVIQNCCAAQIQSLQTDVNLFNQQAPAFGGKFRNLNLLVIGLNMVSDIVNRAHGIRDSLLALKKAPDLQTAATALQDLVTKLDGTKQSISSGFSDLATNGNGAFDAGNGAGNTFSSEPLPSGSESQDASKSDSASSQPAQQKENGESAKEKLKKEFKKRFHFPH